MKTLVIVIAASMLSGCGGAGKAAINAGKGFDRFACMSRNFKGEPPCPQLDTPPQPANQ